MNADVSQPLTSRFLCESEVPPGVGVSNAMLRSIEPVSLN